MSFSFAKLKSYLPGVQQHNNNISEQDKNNRHSVSLEPEIGFQITLEPGTTSSIGATSTGNNKKNDDNNNVPSLNVHLISARHLPSLFGFKTVQGYQIKVKLFPGSKKFDSNIQTNTWPKFDETFKFLLEPNIKPSIKNYSNIDKNANNLPDKLCSGHFIVFTVYALLELPPGSFNRFKGTYRSLREKGNSFLRGKTTTNDTKMQDKSKETDKKDDLEKQTKISSGIQHQLTQSESRRNIGSVTCFLDSKIFKENRKTGRYMTDEMWLPIKDITSTPLKSSNTANSSTKGQIELILELQDSLGDENLNEMNDKPTATTSASSTSISVVTSASSSSSSSDIEKNTKKEKLSILKKQLSINEMKKMMKTTTKLSKDNNKQLYLRVITSKMRCSIKIKDEFENSAGQIYVKTSIYEHNILSNSWKCDNFLPSLSTRWDPEISVISIPINDENNLKNISIKTTVATKTKIGKKIILGTILIGPQTSGSGLEHWNSVISSRNEPIAKWHNFQ